MHKHLLIKHEKRPLCAATSWLTATEILNLSKAFSIEENGQMDDRILGFLDVGVYMPWWYVYVQETLKKHTHQLSTPGNRKVIVIFSTYLASYKVNNTAAETSVSYLIW